MLHYYRRTIFLEIYIWLEKRAETISARARLILFIFIVQFLFLKCEMSGHYDRMPLDHLEKKLPAKWKALWYTVSHNLTLWTRREGPGLVSSFFFARSRAVCFDGKHDVVLGDK